MLGVGRGGGGRRLVGAHFARQVVRAALGFGLGTAEPLLTRRLDAASALAAVDWGAAGGVLAAMLLGAWGWLGHFLGAWLPLPGSLPRSLSRSALLLLVQAAPALLALLFFARRRRSERGLGDLRSYLLLILAALVGSAVAGSLSSRIVFRSWMPAAAWIWSAGMATAIVLLLPPVCVLAGNVRRTPWRELLRLREDGADREGEPPLGRRLELAGLGLLMVALTAVAAFALSRVLPRTEPWLNLVLLMPVLWGATVAGLRGGIYTGSTVGLAFLAGHELLRAPAAPVGGHDQAIALFPAIFLFCLVGALFGAAREREIGLNRELREVNRLLREDLDRAVRALTAAIEAKDAYTEGHVGRVSKLAEAVGRRLGLGDAEREALRWASILHDVGKIGVPEQILRKPGPLTPEERAVMQRHAELGARILDNVAGMEGAAALVLRHQERFDGRRDGPFPGYPGGLAGEAIPLGARIIAVADAFDAMTSDRPYRAGRSPAQAAEELRRESGRQFDPRVVEAFLDELGSGSRISA